MIATPTALSETVQFSSRVPFFPPYGSLGSEIKDGTRRQTPVQKERGMVCVCVCVRVCVRVCARARRLSVKEEGQGRAEKRPFLLPYAGST